MSLCTVHLVRHAEHRQFGLALTGRMEGVGLSERGWQQAAALARHYTGVEARGVLTSPVQRARETAGVVGDALGKAPTVEPALVEIDFGAWTGQTFEALAGTAGWDGWNSARSLAPAPGSETMLTVQARAMSALLHLRPAGGLVVVVSHSDVIRAVLAHVLGMPLDLLHRLEVGPASRSVVTLGDDWARVDAVNLPP